MDINKYINDAEKHYHLRLKTVVPIDDKAMSRIERVIYKYNPISVGKPKKTILQKSPLDFPREVENAEVWIVDFVFTVPASPMVMREDIRKALDAPELFVIVKTRNDPTEIENLRLSAIEEINKEAKDKGLVPDSLLSADPEYIEGNGNIDDGSNLFGNAFNIAFLHYLKTVEDERKEMKTGNQLFNWLDMPKSSEQEPYQSPEDFNKDIKDAPKPAPAKNNVKLPDVKNLGNQNDQDRTVSKVFRDKNGKKVVITRKFGDEE